MSEKSMPGFDDDAVFAEKSFGLTTVRRVLGLKERQRRDSFGEPHFDHVPDDHLTHFVVFDGHGRRVDSFLTWDRAWDRATLHEGEVRDQT